MKFVTTPKEITPQILEMCRSICQSTLRYIPVMPAAGSLPCECFPNVNGYIDKQGGTAVNGWAIWQRANVLIEAEAHCIWASPSGDLIDITPHSHGEQEILFLRDDSLVYNGLSIPSVRMPLTSSPLVREFIDLFEERDAIMSKELGMVYELPVQTVRRMHELEYLFHTKVGRNEPCPCGSGLKYKRCCGQYE